MPGQPQPVHVLGGQKGLAQLELAHVLRGLVEEVLLPPDEAHQRHHELLAQRVDRRVGHLREELLEVAEEQDRALGEHRERRVVAHRADRLLPARGHRGEHHPALLLGVAVGVLAGAQQRRVLGGDLRGLEEAAQLDAVGVHPVAVGALAGDPGLDLAVGDHAVLLEVDEEHPARLEAAAAQDALGRELDDAGLGGEHDEAVPGLGPARGAQAVAVEGAADEAPVGEGHRGRPVPGLHEGRVVLVEGAPVLADLVARPPGLGDQHHHRVRQRAAAEHEQLERVVEHRRVRAVLLDDRQQLLQVVAEERGGEDRLAGAHPVDVAAQRVDLAVVRRGGGTAARAARTGACSSSSAGARGRTRSRTAGLRGPGRTGAAACRSASPCRGWSARRGSTRRRSA